MLRTTVSAVVVTPSTLLPAILLIGLIAHTLNCLYWRLLTEPVSRRLAAKPWGCAFCMNVWISLGLSGLVVGRFWHWPDLSPLVDLLLLGLGGATVSQILESRVMICTGWQPPVTPESEDKVPAETEAADELLQSQQGARLAELQAANIERVAALYASVPTNIDFASELAAMRQEAEARVVGDATVADPAVVPDDCHTTRDRPRRAARDTRDGRTPSEAVSAMASTIAQRIQQDRDAAIQNPPQNLPDRKDNDADAIRGDRFDHPPVEPTPPPG